MDQEVRCEQCLCSGPQAFLDPHMKAPKVPLGSILWVKYHSPQVFEVNPLILSPSINPLRKQKK